MKIKLEHKEKHYEADLSRAFDISIPLKSGPGNPNCYYAAPVEFITIKSGNFIGSVVEGGSVNHKTIKLSPHGNGTHTECYAHISSDTATLNQCLTEFHFLAQVLTVTPRLTANNDKVLALEDLSHLIQSGITAIVIRTLPNDKEKLTRQYSGTNPPYIDVNVTDFLRQQNIAHLLTDLPSVDQEIDGGALKAHRSFWNFDKSIRKDCTITELIYVNNDIPDGLYLLNLQITSLESDASPSKPVLYKVNEC